MNRLGPAIAIVCLAAAACVRPPDRAGDKTGEQAQEADAPKALPASASVKGPTPAAGDVTFAPDISWRGLEEGREESAASAKPMMVFIHTEWCPKCKVLKPGFTDPELVKLSEEFVMVSVDQDLVPGALDYAPDGQYIPRVVFAEPGGQVDASVQAGNPRFRYFYTRPQDVVAAMRRKLGST